jgi:redox-sensitive bicupin YhaK (pirin superfamily)
MKREGTTIRLFATSPDTKVLILAGAPLNEPIAAQGPFVMNTFDEIRQANADFRSGKMGR